MKHYLLDRYISIDSMGKKRFFQTPKDYRKNPVRKFHTPSKEVEAKFRTQN